MPSLDAHLRLPDDHSGLPFHPSCPVCRRDRLTGSLTGDELVSPRTQAALAAGLLAFSGAGAPTAMASDPDTETVGITEVVDDAESEPLDIGGDTVQLVDEAPPTPQAATPPVDAATPLTDDEDLAALEQERETDALEPATETTEHPVAPPAEATPDPEADPVAPQPAEAPTASGVGGDGEIRAERSKRMSIERERPSHAADDAVVLAPREPAARTVAPAPAAPRTIRVIAGASAGRATPGARVHVVRPGESLWSIATELLGSRASVAQVAGEVDRLWELNEDQIASGDPDLLFAGTRLMLR